MGLHDKVIQKFFMDYSRTHFFLATKVSKPAPKNTCMLDKDQRSQQRPSKNAPDNCFPLCWRPVAIMPVPLSMPRKPKLVVWIPKTNIRVGCQPFIFHSGLVVNAPTKKLKKHNKGDQQKKKLTNWAVVAL